MGNCEIRYTDERGKEHIFMCLRNEEYKAGEKQQKKMAKILKESFDELFNDETSRQAHK